MSPEVLQENGKLWKMNKFSRNGYESGLDKWNMTRIQMKIKHEQMKNKGEFLPGMSSMVLEQCLAPSRSCGVTDIFLMIGTLMERGEREARSIEDRTLGRGGEHC